MSPVHTDHDEMLIKCVCLKAQMHNSKCLCGLIFFFMFQQYYLVEGKLQEEALCSKKSCNFGRIFNVTIWMGETWNCLYIHLTNISAHTVDVGSHHSVHWKHLPDRFSEGLVCNRHHCCCKTYLNSEPGLKARSVTFTFERLCESFYCSAVRSIENSWKVEHFECFELESGWELCSVAGGLSKLIKSLTWLPGHRGWNIKVQTEKLQKDYIWTISGYFE